MGVVGDEGNRFRRSAGGGGEGREALGEAAVSHGGSCGQREEEEDLLYT